MTLATWSSCWQIPVYQKKNMNSFIFWTFSSHPFMMWNTWWRVVKTSRYMIFFLIKKACHCVSLCLACILQCLLGASFLLERVCYSATWHRDLYGNHLCVVSWAVKEQAFFPGHWSAVQSVGNISWMCSCKGWVCSVLDSQRAFFNFNMYSFLFIWKVDWQKKCSIYWFIPPSVCKNQGCWRAAWVAEPGILP